MAVDSRNKDSGTIVKYIMALASKHKLFSIAAGLIIIASVSFGMLYFFNFTQAKADDSKWKNFSENNYGFSISYPAGWSFDAEYDRYAPGLIDAVIKNKECGSSRGVCAADCADIRILAGKKPEGKLTQPLFVQLYEDLLAVKDTNNPELVQNLEIGGKTVYKVLSETPTLSMTNSCGGPLYIFETDSGYFAYVFTGLGSVYGEEATIEKIISSINIKGKGN